MCTKVEFEKSFDFQNYVPIIRDHMLPYYEERGVEWVESEKLDHYRKCDLFILRDEDEVGFIMFLEQDGDFYLSELHIYDKFQARGYGSQALRWALKHAAGFGLDALKVRVFGNNPAYRLYLGNGFRFDKRYPHTDQLAASAHNKRGLRGRAARAPPRL